MSRKLCIHGHFYQPPREDPWLGRIFSEASAAPLRHWNERITRESYAPLAWARRLGEHGGIKDIVNCYEWISFNVGPTLLHWLEREAPEVLERIQAADAASLRRLGHGNALAQIYHHVIMPLASDLDKKLEVRWALDDFERRFGRAAEGMWLSECAVDTASLEVLAAEGIRFVTISPYQAAAVAAPGQDFTPLATAAASSGHAGAPGQETAACLDISRPYRVGLPSGREMAVFFYHGNLAQSVAFDGLLADGERFWQRLRQAAEHDCAPEGILSMATDGETYGHHFKFGEMSLAYVLEQARAGRDGLELTNFASYLEKNQPTWQARLIEPSSWSCAHGVERWRSDCGCTSGGHANWNQKWRAPLRQVMDEVKSALDEHFFSAGQQCFKDPAMALLEFGQVLANPAFASEYAAKHFLQADSQADSRAAPMLLRMQENGLAAFASCAWFFDDISRIEPVKALSFALRAMELCRLTNGPDLQPLAEKLLAQALSNQPGEGSGRDVFTRRVLPSRQDAASLCLFSYLHAYCDDVLPKDCTGDVSMVYPALRVRLGGIDCASAFQVSGRAFIAHPEAADGLHCAWSGLLPSNAPELQHEQTGSLPGSSVLLGQAWLRAELPAGLSAKDGQGGDQGDGKAEVFQRNSPGLARHLHDFLNIRLLRRTVWAGAAERAITLAHCVSNLQRLEEGQETWHSDEGWGELLPYLPLACFYLPHLLAAQRLYRPGGHGLSGFAGADVPVSAMPGSIDHTERGTVPGNTGYFEQVEQAAAIMHRLGASGLIKKRAAALLEEAILEVLAQKSLTDAELAAAVRRAAKILPEMNWWKAQNYLWDNRLCQKGYPQTAVAIGFEARY